MEKIIDGDNLIIKTQEEKVYSISALENEKAELEAKINEGKPSKNELEELGKLYHSYYTEDKSVLENRVSEINNLLA